jgi:hypothetical protein
MTQEQIDQLVKVIQHWNNYGTIRLRRKGDPSSEWSLRNRRNNDSQGWLPTVYEYEIVPDRIELILSDWLRGGPWLVTYGSKVGGPGEHVDFEYVNKIYRDGAIQVFGKRMNGEDLVHSGLIRSNDGGETWQACSRPNPDAA